MPFKLFPIAGGGRLHSGSTHAVILKHFNIRKYTISDFAFQSILILMGTQNKKNFSNVTITYRNNPKYPLKEALGRSLVVWVG